MKLSVILLSFFAVAKFSYATCIIENAPTSSPDALATLLSSTNRCPRDVTEFRTLLGSQGASVETTSVSNRGFHGQTSGSFSLFEIAQLPNFPSVDLFFGHFTHINDHGQLDLDQNHTQTGLMIELIVWDATKQVYNFYELISASPMPKWFYRGDSNDIIADVAPLHLEQPSFKNKLRCAGCHISGGPIMKEATAPFDSWWTETRPLQFGLFNLSPRLKVIIDQVSDAAVLADAVSKAQHKLQTSKAFFNEKKDKGLNVLLRPLFCDEDVNFASSPTSIDDNHQEFIIPSSAFINPWFDVPNTLSMSKTSYMNALLKTQSLFPGTDKNDADHAWLAPVKALSDKEAINHLVREGIITSEFVSDVLALDHFKPTFSDKRCRLLSLVPETLTKDWHDIFVSNLKKHNGDSAAAALWRHLVDPAMNEAFHKTAAKQYAASCKQVLADDMQSVAQISFLNRTRAEIRASAISTHPRGEILEPGFRVIFPRVTPPATPWTMHRQADCTVKSVD